MLTHAIVQVYTTLTLSFVLTHLLEQIVNLLDDKLVSLSGPLHHMYVASSFHFVFISNPPCYDLFFNNIEYISFMNILLISYIQLCLDTQVYTFSFMLTLQIFKIVLFSISEGQNYIVYFQFIRGQRIASF